MSDVGENWKSFINFSKIPNGIISGKSGWEIEAMAIKASTSNYSFPDISPGVIEELNKAEQIFSYKRIYQILKTDFC